MQSNFTTPNTLNFNALSLRFNQSINGANGEYLELKTSLFFSLSLSRKLGNHRRAYFFFLSLRDFLSL